MHQPDVPWPVALHRFFSPYWLFKDAARGSMYERAAAHRHNRRMRAHLPAYMRRWLMSCIVAFVLMVCFEVPAAVADGRVPFSMLLAAGFGVLFAWGVCMIFVTAYAYLALGRSDGPL